jgi:hypothetical protein
MIPNQTEDGPIKCIPGRIWSVKLCEHIKWKVWNEKLSQFRVINVQNLNSVASTFERAVLGAIF